MCWARVRGKGGKGVGGGPQNNSHAEPHTATSRSTQVHSGPHMHTDIYTPPHIHAYRHKPRRAHTHTHTHIYIYIYSRAQAKTARAVAHVRNSGSPRARLHGPRFRRKRRQTRSGRVVRSSRQALGASEREKGTEHVPLPVSLGFGSVRFGFRTPIFGGGSVLQPASELLLK